MKKKENFKVPSQWRKFEFNAFSITHLTLSGGGGGGGGGSEVRMTKLTAAKEKPLIL